MSIKFFDPDSDSSVVDPKIDIDLENDLEIPLCDSCQNIILMPYKEHPKLICPNCHTIYNPKYEYIQIQDQETTLDDLSSKGEMTFINDSNSKPKNTLNQRNARIEDNIPYVKKEFEKYHDMEIIDETKKSLRRKNNHRSPN